MGNVIHTKISEGRRVAIPAELCEQYGIAPGDPVVLEPLESGIVVRPMHAVTREGLEIANGQKSTLDHERWLTKWPDDSTLASLLFRLRPEPAGCWLKWSGQSA